MGPRKLFDIQGSPPPSSRAVHPNKQEAMQKLQETHMDEQRVTGKTQTRRWTQAQQTQEK